MKLIFSRKGLDNISGGYPSPISDGRAISLPIPENDVGCRSYASLVFDFVESLTHGRIKASDIAHTDPLAQSGRVYFGQAGAAQAHLANNGVGVGDTFLFFGLFQDYPADRFHPDARPHHRIFGLMEVEQVLHLGNPPNADLHRVPSHHPHLHRGYFENNTVYVGQGCLGAPATDLLRLSLPAGPLSRWRVPAWLAEYGMTYHGKSERWGDGTLDTTAPGQEFVCSIPQADREARQWLQQIIEACAS